MYDKGVYPMLISKAYAAAAAAEAPSAWEAFGLNMLLIGILVVLFYVLLIKPQQKRFKQHREMIEALKKGDKILTAGGLVGRIDEIKPGAEEVQIDLGNNIKVTALRSTIQSRKE